MALKLSCISERLQNVFQNLQRNLAAIPLILTLESKICHFSIPVFRPGPLKSVLVFTLSDQND